MAAAFVAHDAPATGYELSIYAETPLSFWVCVGGIVAIAVLLGVHGFSYRHGISLGSLLLLMLVALPAMRGYYYVHADALTHLGIAKLIANGGPALQQFYPVTHILAIVLHETTGLPLRMTLMLLTPIFALLFFIFAALSVTQLYYQRTRWDAVAIGFFSGFLLLPVNWFGVNLKPHPYTFATLTVIFPLFIIFRNWRNESIRFDFLFFILYPFMMMLHPQQAVNLFLMLVIIYLIKFPTPLQKVPYLRKYHEYITPRSSVHLLQPVVLGLFTLYYLSSYEQIRDTAGTVVVNLFSGGLFGNVEVASQSQSLGSIGVTVIELVLKIFGPGLVFGLIAGLNVGVSLKNIWKGRFGQRDQMVLAAALIAVPLAVGFAAFYFGDFQRLFLRYIGVLMVITTLLGGVGMVHTFRKFNSAKAALVITLVMGGFLVASIPTIQPSPYIVIPSGHVTESTMDGYDLVFTYRHQEIELEAIRSPSYRYEEALYGKRVPHVHNFPPYHFAGHALPNHYNSDRYLVVTEHARQIDVILYEGLRYTKDDFAYLNNDPSISKIMSAGEIDLFLVNSSSKTGMN